MVLWQGLTEGGTAVPVQVTEAGRVVAEGQQGPPGEEGPQGPKGDQGPQGEYGPGDDVDLGSITAAGAVQCERPADSTSDGFAIKAGTKKRFGVDASGSLKLSDDIATDTTVSIELKASDGSIKSVGNGNFGLNGGTVSRDEEGVGISAAGALVTYVSSESDLNSNAFAVFKTTAAGGGITCSVKKNGSASFAGNTCGFTSEGEIYMTSRGTRYKIFVSQGLVQAEPYTREMELRERAEALRKPRTTDSVPED